MLNQFIRTLVQVLTPLVRALNRFVITLHKHPMGAVVFVAVVAVSAMAWVSVAALSVMPR